jgi:hypothetical protein
MQRTNIYLDEDQLLTLKFVAAHQRRSVAAVVREAVGDYLAKTLTRDVAMQLFAETVEKFWADVPPDVSPEEIEADITIASAEVRLRRNIARLSLLEDWERESAAITDRFRERVHLYMTAEEIEAEVAAALEELQPTWVAGRSA